MRRLLLASTCSIAFATAASAQTIISTPQTSPIRTSTITQGTSDDVRIAPTGSVVVTTSGIVVTIDGPNRLINEGLISAINANTATGIQVLPGIAGNILNSGRIILDDTYVPVDSDNDGDADGPFSVGFSRDGIELTVANTGDLVNTGLIRVTGNTSFGIVTGGAVNGNIINEGTISVTGTSSIAVGLRDVTGSVRLAGTISALGEAATGAFLKGNIGGTLTVQGGITSTGYRYTTPPADRSKLDVDDLLQGESALVVEGNVAGGIILAAQGRDGVTTSGMADVRSYSAAPAVRIGSSAHDIDIGLVPGTNAGLIIDGTIQGDGLYRGVLGSGLRVGGTGGKVTIAGGIAINGTVRASGLGAAAVAVNLSDATSTPQVEIAGTIEATSSASGDLTASAAAGLVVGPGATVPVIHNNGTLKATADGVLGIAIAVTDFSGTTRVFQNGGTIMARGGTTDFRHNVALDFSHSTAGVDVTQTVVPAGAALPSITGNILLGTGDDVLHIASGTVTGTTDFDAGDDQLLVTNGAIYEGNLFFGSGSGAMALLLNARFAGAADFGGGASTLEIDSGARFTGSLVHSEGTSISLSGGTLDLNASAHIANLAVSNGGTLALTLGAVGDAPPLVIVTGTASFAAASKLMLRIPDLASALGPHVVLTAGTLTGAGNIVPDVGPVPFLFKATVSSTPTDLIVTLAPKSVPDLDFGRPESAAFNAVYGALSNDTKVGDVFLTLSSGDQLRAAISQMLPDYAGGTFQMVTQGSRAFARMLDDPAGPFQDEGNWGYWISQSVWSADKARDATAGYKTSGWGLGTGAEIKTDLGDVGASFAYYRGSNRAVDSANRINDKQYELAGYWRLQSGSLRAGARGAISFIDLAGSRHFQGVTGTGEQVSRTTNVTHSARLYSGSATLSYGWTAGRWSLRPVASFDYYRFREKGYAETGGGDAFDLIVGARTSDEFAFTGSAVVGVDLRGKSIGLARVELEAGRREIVAGALGGTTARFAGGENFTIEPGQRSGGWIGRLRGVAGNARIRLSGELSAERFEDKWAPALRTSLRIGF